MEVTKLHPEPDMELFESWKKYHQENPGMFKLILKYGDIAFENQHRQRFGIGAITEIIRWDTMFQNNNNNEPFKCSNNHRAFYARLYMNVRNRPGFFTLKRSVADDVPEAEWDRLARDWRRSSPFYG